MSIATHEDLPFQYPHDEMERHAYNAAFHELGLRWHWDQVTYRQLLARSAVAAERVRLYLEEAQPHLLRAYDAAFLVEAIEARKTHHRRLGAGQGRPWVPVCNWDAMQAAQVGA